MLGVLVSSCKKKKPEVHDTGLRQTSGTSTNVTDAARPTKPDAASGHDGKCRGENTYVRSFGWLGVRLRFGIETLIPLIGSQEMAVGFRCY